ncbi:RagB/SusD family nutrient uptake outer membrane protein [uncultured Alistipes sp.]|uniref:RagB/SusD family nutrient uptake outer membrane protein n=1 Tax=uncultured Alistipes sp. TaxID=538949 RepID=UPI002805546F|nr:RagB/SusD family nutrient uptake outer membrane protein [uncultured Alistipes sp.]
MKRIIILAVALTAGLSSCDLLDTKPMSQMTQTDYFKTETDLQLFTNPLYNNMLDKDPYDDQSDLMVCQTLSDEILGGNKRTVPNSGGGWTWTDLRRINTLLEYADQCDDKDAVTHYTALARFFRAYFYFEKVKRFGDVPWYDVQLGSADEALYNPRDSRELIMTKMIEDIDFAINELPEEVSTYRVNRWAALALKAQFCLYEGTYRKYHDVQIDGANDYTYYLDLAAKAAGEVINQGPYKLYSTGNPDSDYMMLFAQENASPDEYILAIKFDYGLAIHHNATAFTLVPTQGRPGYTRKMVNMYLMKDGSRFTDRTGWQEESFVEETKDRDPRLAQSIRTPGYTRIGKTEVLAPDFGCSVTGYQPIKFVQNPDDSGGNVDRNDRSTCDIPVYRLAEVMLNYAEAKAELGTLTQDDLDISINKIRDRVDMPHLKLAEANANPDWYLLSSEYGFSNVSGANQGVILEIRRERAIEMIQEGTRYEDLVRWKAGPCLDQALTGMYFPGAGQYDLTGDGKTDLILYNEGSAKPEAGDGVYVYQIGTEILLSGGTRGYVSYHKNIERTPYNEERDYLYPIPINERSLNPDLTQNPGWNDGLSF